MKLPSAPTRRKIRERGWCFDLEAGGKMGCNNSKGADTSAFSQPTTNLDDEEEAGLEQMLAYELEFVRAIPLGLSMSETNLQVLRVDPGGQAEQMRVKPGMYIVTINGRQVNTQEEFLTLLAQTETDTVKVCFTNDARAATQTVTLNKDAELGIALAEGSLLVMKVDPTSQAKQAGVKPGLFIITVNGQSVATQEEFFTVMGTATSSSIELTLSRGPRSSAGGAVSQPAPTSADDIDADLAMATALSQSEAEASHAGDDDDEEAAMAAAIAASQADAEATPGAGAEVDAAAGGDEGADEGDM